MKSEIILTDGTKLDFVGMAVTVDPDVSEVVIIDKESVVEGTFNFDEVQVVHFYPNGR